MAQTLRPLGIGELLDRTFAIYRRHFLLFFGIAATAGLVTLAGGLMQVGAGWMVGAGTNVAVTVAVWLVAAVMTLWAAAMTQGATVIAVSEIQMDREATIGASFRAVRPIAGSLASTSIVASLKIFLALLLLIVPGVLLALRYTLMIPVAVLEGRFGGDATDRSAELTRGSRGRIFLIYGILIVLFFIATMMLSIPIGIAMVVISRASFGGLVAGRIWQYGISSLLTPLLTIGITVMYYDQRVRNEAFDLQHLMEQLDRNAPVSVS